MTGMTEDRLREIYGPASPRAAVKEIDHIDTHVRAFIEASPFLVLATSDGMALDVSPKGDPAGFVEIEDDRHLLLPDRRGNNRIDGLLNIVRHPQVALLFMIPTVGETMRINGRAEILEDQALRERFAVKGRLPATVTRITVEVIFSHCGKAPLRGGLWNPATWPTERPVGTLGEIVSAHSGLAMAKDQASTDQLYRETLY